MSHRSLIFQIIRGKWNQRWSAGKCLLSSFQWPGEYEIDQGKHQILKVLSLEVQIVGKPECLLLSPERKGALGGCPEAPVDPSITTTKWFLLNVYGNSPKNQIWWWMPPFRVSAVTPPSICDIDKSGLAYPMPCSGSSLDLSSTPMATHLMPPLPKWLHSDSPPAKFLPG